MKAKNFVFDNAWLVFGLWTLLVIALSMLLALLARERPTDVPKYVNEPPEDLPPAIAYALATEGEYDDRVVLATLLSLVDRGYYDAKASQGDELDLELSVPAERPPVETLEAYEMQGAELLRRPARRQDRRSRQAQGRDPPALEHLALALGEPDRRARPGRRGRDQLGPRPRPARGSGSRSIAAARLSSCSACSSTRARTSRRSRSAPPSSGC